MTNVTLFGEWLMRTRLLQRKAYGTDPANLEPDARAAYFREMAAATMFEIGEMSNEIGWKSWGKDRTIHRDNYIKEGVDVLHFVANMLVLAGCTDEELNTAYLKKMAVNQKRQDDGYDGRVVGKCPRCTRSYDDVGEVPDRNHCTVCEAELLLEGKESSVN